ncbi:hypothetical protein GVAV_002952 [Gurleya vavrai]
MPRKNINKYKVNDISKTDNQKSDDNKDIMRNEKGQERSFREKERHVLRKTNACQENFIFGRGMRGVKIKLEIFMIEFEERFEDKSLRGKMMEVIKRSSDEVRNAFYVKGVANELQDSWESFKSWLLEYCTGTSIEKIIKYQNESWSNYCIRLQETGMVRGWTEDAILEKLKGMKLPSELKIILFSVGVTLDVAIEAILKMEETDQINGSVLYKKDEKILIGNIAGKKNLKKCYKCGKVGHLQINCFMKEKKEVRCYKCGKIGHLSYDCNKLENNNVKLKINNLII